VIGFIVAQGKGWKCGRGRKGNEEGTRDRVHARGKDQAPRECAYRRGSCWVGRYQWKKSRGRFCEFAFSCCWLDRHACLLKVGQKFQKYFSYFDFSWLVIMLLINIMDDFFTGLDFRNCRLQL